MKECNTLVVPLIGGLTTADLKVGKICQRCHLSIDAVFVDGEFDTKEESEAYQQLLLCALLCGQARNTSEGWVGSSEDIALAKYALESNSKLSEVDKNIVLLQVRKSYQRARAHKSSTNRFFEASVFDTKSDVFPVYLKGEANALVKRCSDWMVKGSV